MAKRRRKPDYDCTATDMAEFKTVFVDTSLDTHFAMIVSSSDTVSEFKKKMVLEHKQCFPTIGEIVIHSVKVKRRSNFYHLPDIMLVWSAFHRLKRNWFLSADVSGARTCHSIKTSCEFDANNNMKLGVTNLDDSCRGLSSDVNRLQTLPIPSPGGATEKNVVLEMIAGFKFEKSIEKTTDFQSNTCSEENCIGTDSRPKKKRKVRNTDDACHNPRAKDDCSLFQASCKDTSIPEVVSSGNVMVDAVSPGGGILHEQNGKGNDHFDSEDRAVFKGPSLPTTTEMSNLGSIMTSQNLLASDERKEENVSGSKMDLELAQDAPTNHLEDISVKVLDHSARLMDASGVGEVNADGSKREKKKVQKTARKVQDTTEMEQTGMGESIQPCSETHESEKEEEKGLPLEHDHEVIMPSNSKASDHVDPESALKEASFSRDADAVIVGIKKRRKKKKNREKKSVNTNPEQSGIEQTDNGTSDCPPSTYYIPGETGNKEGITNHEGKDVQVLSDNSTGDAATEVQGVNRSEGDSVILAQTEQTPKDLGSGKKIAYRKAQGSAGNCCALLPAVETGNPDMEFNQVYMSNENTENKDRKASKKRKKRKLTASQVQENLPVEDQQVGIRALTTEETSISFVNSEQEDRHADSFQVLSSKTEEKLNEAHGIVENTYNLVKTSEKEGDGINFKQYFVPGQYQDKVDSGDKVKKATNSNHEMEISKRVKDNVVPSVTNSTELQSAIKSFVNKKAENISRRKGSIRSKEDSAQSSGRNEIISNSFSRSSGASEKGAKDSRPSEMCETTLQKPDEILAASSHLNKKNHRSLDKSSSERSEILPGRQGNKRLQLGMNVTNMMLMKTPQKKSLLTKQGAIFRDNSDDSSGDENGTMHSDGSTLSPSDSSSMSDGSSDAEGRSTGQRKMSKFDLSDSKDNITMDMILRSSKRFRKAKLLASQNEDQKKESQPIEFVPDSQPS